VEEGDNVPCRIEAAQCSGVLGGRVVVLLFRYPAEGSLCLPCCTKLDEICDEEMCGHEEVEDQAGDDVRASVVVTADTDQDAVLQELALDRITLSQDIPFVG
jgi:hypothetical protein